MPADRRMEATLAPDPRSAGEARRLLSRAVRSFGCEPLEDTGTLLLSELVANSVLHAHTDIRVVVEPAEGGLRVSVSDGSQTAPRRRHYSAEATTGRGMALVETMADDWGV